MSLTPRKPGVAQKEPSAELSIQCVDMAVHRCTVYTPALLRPDSLAQAFYDRIGTADALLFSFAEHNGFVTAAWKSIFDWMSRINAKVWRSIEHPEPEPVHPLGVCT